MGLGVGMMIIILNNFSLTYVLEHEFDVLYEYLL